MTVGVGLLTATLNPTFLNHQLLTELPVEATTSKITYTDEQKITYNLDKVSLTAEVASYAGLAGADIVIPDIIVNNGQTYAITSIGTYAFSNSGIRSVIIGNNVVDINTSAFQTTTAFPDYYKKSLTKVVLGAKVQNIKTDAQKEELAEKIVFYAAAYGTLEEMKESIDETGVTMEILDSEENNLLMAAALGGNEETFSYLWDQISHDTINKRKETLLMAALGGGNKNIAEKIKESDENIFVSLDQFDWDDAFRQQCEVLSYADDEFTEYYIENEKPDLDETEYLCTSITDNGNIAALKIIKKNKNTKEYFNSSEFLNNILQLCFSSSQVRTILEDIPNDIKKELTYSLAKILSEESQMPNEDSEEIVQAFYNAGVPLDNYKGVRLPIYEAASVGDTAAVRKLAELGADLDDKGKIGATAMLPAARGDEDTLEVLLKFGANPNESENKTGLTPLMIAVSWESPECVRMLLDYGADKDAIKKDGTTVYEYAQNVGSEEIITMLD